MPHDTLYHDEDTLTLAVEALKRHGLNGQEVVRILTNAGILLRERGPQAGEAAESAQEPAEARQAIRVTCEVEMPLGSVTEALSVLHSVPISGSLGLRTSGLPTGQRALCQEDLDRMRPRVVIRWEESR